MRVVYILVEIYWIYIKTLHAEGLCCVFISVYPTINLFNVVFLSKHQVALLSGMCIEENLGPEQLVRSLHTVITNDCLSKIVHVSIMSLKNKFCLLAEK